MTDTTEVEIVGGPQDGKVYVLMGQQHEVQVAMPNFVPIKLIDNDMTPTFEVVTFSVRERADGSRYINWWEVRHD